MRGWLVGTAALVVVAGCEKEAPPAPPAPHASVEAKRAKVRAAPVQAFVAPEAWRPSFGEGEEIPPPDVTKETWRAYVSQTTPLQRETPHWQALPADQAVPLAMPESSRFRCVAQPVKISTQSNDFGTKFKGWTITRDVYCSSDDWASWQIYPQHDFLRPDGTREMLLLTQANLRERDADDDVVEIVVITRSDEDQRAARTGPPQILAGVEVDDD